MAESQEYQVQPGYSLRGKSSGELIELDPESSETIQWLDDERISVEIDPLIIPPPPDAFSRLRSSIEETPIFGKVYTVSKLAQPVSVAYSLTMNAIDNRNLRNLAFAMQDLVAEMAAATEPFTEAELATVNGWIADAGFAFQLQPAASP